MTTASAAPSAAAPASAASSPGAGNGPWGKLSKLLPEQARARLTDLLQQLETQSAGAVKATGQLTTEIEQKMARDLSRVGHTYGIFQVGHPRRHVVLRDVQELNGEKPLFVASDFASAMQYASRTLTDPVRDRRGPINCGDLLKELERFAHEIHHLMKVNARLTGSGTEADPFVVHDGVLHVDAPITHGFPGVTPDQLILRVRDGKLHVLAAPPS